MEKYGILTPVLIPALEEYNMSSDREKKLQLLKQKIAKCSECGLAQYRAQKVPPDGKPNASIVFIGKAPGAEEVARGKPFVGQSGDRLNEIITESKLTCGIFLCNILCCRTPDDRPPLIGEAKKCRPFIDEMLDIVQPKVVCCLGEVAAKQLLGSQYRYATIDEMRGRVFDYDETPVICTHHPKTRKEKEVRVKDMLQDFQTLKEMAKR